LPDFAGTGREKSEMVFHVFVVCVFVVVVDDLVPVPLELKPCA
jgi:hypothetical protein